MLHYITLATDQDDIKVTAMVFDGKIAMPSLEFELNGKMEYWDNPKYLFEEFYPFLKRYRDRCLIPIDLKEGELMNWLNDDLVNQLIEMLEEAIKQKWNEV